MSVWFGISTALFGLSLLAIPVFLVLLVIKKLTGKETGRTKKELKIAALVFLASIAFVIITAPPSDNKSDVGEKQSEQNDVQSEVKKQEPIAQKNDEQLEQSMPGVVEENEECEHIWIEIHRIEPSYESSGESISQCTICLEEIKTVIPKLEKLVTFSEIYNEYKANELRADELYKNNRYVITGEVNGMETGGLLNWSGGATLTMETRVGNTRVFYYAEFEKEQEDALKTINVGDTITFEGECLGAGSWADCKLILG